MTKIHKRSRRLSAFFAVAVAVAALVAALAAGCGSTKSSGASSQANATDSAFVQQMIPHHEMAIQMARSAQQQAQHPQIKTLAGDIIAAQTREIAQLKPIANGIGVTPDQMPMTGASADHMAMGATGSHMSADASALGLSMDQMGMSMNMSALDTARPFDRAFIDMMIPHHQGAIRMARAELGKGDNPQLRTIASAIVTQQAKEIAAMNAWRAVWYGETSPAGGVPAA